MQQLLYVSNTSRNADPAMLADILSASRRNNPRLSVTGMLLYIDGGFLQILEGAEDVLTGLFKTISLDKRHWNAQILLRRQAERAFADWSMGFHRLEQKDDALFQISRDAIAGHLKNADQPILLRLMQNFYRIQSGEAGM